MTQHHRDLLARDGYVFIEGLLDPGTIMTIAPMIDRIVGLTPRGEDDAAVKNNSRSQFPFDDIDVALSCLNESLLSTAGQLLGVDMPILCEATVYARFGQHDVVGERELTAFHTHWDGSALVPPPTSLRPGAIAANVFWFETTADNAPMLLVRREDVPGQRRVDRADVAEGSLTLLASPAYGQPGDVLFYELDTYHRSSRFRDSAGRRVTHRIVYSRPDATWVCRRVPGAAHPTMREVLKSATPRQRAALGIPPGMAGYWRHAAGQTEHIPLNYQEVGGRLHSHDER